MSVIDEEEYEQLSLFCKKGFSRNWNDLDLRKKNTYGNIQFSEGPASEVAPDLDYEEIDAINWAREIECVTEHLEMWEPEIDSSEHSKKWVKNNSENNDQLSDMLKSEELEKAKSENQAASENTPVNKHLLSKESNEFKQDDTMAQTNALLKEKIDDSIHVSKCINRKDVVIKSILRSMRKYYSDLVQDNSEYKRKIRNISVKHKTLVNCWLSLAKALSLTEKEENVAFYLTAIAFPSDLKKILNKTIAQNPESKENLSFGLKTIDIIENAMTRFSKKVMKDFMDIPEICLLLVNYLGKVKNSEYEDHYTMLKDMADGTLKTIVPNFNSKVNGVFINFCITSEGLFECSKSTSQTNQYYSWGNSTSKITRKYDGIMELDYMGRKASVQSQILSKSTTYEDSCQK